MKKLYSLALLFASLSSFGQLIAWYDFNGNANDISGANNHGSATGTTPATDRNGTGGAAYYFDGIAAQVLCPSLVLNSSHISMGFWSQRSTFDGNWHAVISQGNASTDQGLHLGLTGTIAAGQQHLGFDLFNDGAYDSTGASSQAWNHWFITYDYGNYNTKIYRNGQLIKNTTLTGYYLGSGPVYIGSTAWGGNYFQGNIDEVMIYQSLLSGAQVDSIYQSQKPACAPFGLSANITDALCHAANNGSANVMTSGGVTPFTFAWTGGQTTNPATGLAGGNYTVVVTDAVGCKDSTSLFVNEPSQLLTTMSATNTTCYAGNNGSAEIFVSGGTPPYSYGWPPLNAFSSSISGVGAGTYTCNVTDINGCTASDTITIQQPANMSLGITVSSGTVCQGQPDTLNVSVSGGSAPYWYEWHDFTGGHTDTTLNNSFVIEPVSTGSTVAGVYVYDALGCSSYTSTFFWTNMADSLSGYVKEPNSNPVTNAKVYLVKQKQSHVGLGDTLAVVNVDAVGHFYVQDLFWGDYFLKVVPDSATYPNSIPTYYSNKAYPFQWDSAVVIQHHTCIGINDTGKNVMIIEITPPTGSGTITGQITAGAGYGQRYSNGGFSPMGAPLKGVDVKLGRNPGGSPAARTTTDPTTGVYTFTNVDTGSYKIYVDIPNYGMDSARVVEITTIDTLSVKNDYYVDSNMVHVVPHYYITNAPAICTGDSVFAGGVYQHIAGTYYDSLLTTMGGDSIIVTDLTVNLPPSVTAVTSSDTICAGGSVTLTGGGAVNYSWTGGVTDGVPFSPTLTDTYTVTGTDNNGCVDSATVSVVVKSCVGINTYDRNGLTAYPNPATSVLTVSSGTIPLAIQVQNVAGEKVMDVVVTGNSTQVDISKLAAGVYFVKVQLSKDGTRYVRIVKQ